MSSKQSAFYIPLNGTWDFTYFDSHMVATAETPNLYTLLIECEGEIIAEVVGFRHIAMQNGVVTLNGESFSSTMGRTATV